MDLAGQHLGKYELLERVGRGGMAYVYKAYQPTIDRFVAVKVLHSHLAEDAEFLERFKREAKGLGRLRHPRIVSVIDFDMAGGWYYMVMDFIEGETLEAVLDRPDQSDATGHQHAPTDAHTLANIHATADDCGFCHRVICRCQLQRTTNRHRFSALPYDSAGDYIGQQRRHDSYSGGCLY